MAKIFQCCNCGRNYECEEADYGTAIEARVMDGITGTSGDVVLRLCRKCWERIRTNTKEGMESGDHFRNGAFVLGCGICEGPISFEGGTLQGVVIVGEHYNSYTDCGGRFRTPICPECWTRILLNVARDMASMLLSEGGEEDVSYS